MWVFYTWVKPSRHLLLGIQQLSALKFLPWMLTAFIHSLLLAYFYICYMTKSTTTLVIGGVVSALILYPQFLVVAAAIRIRRLNNERRKIESARLLTEPEIGAIQNIGSPTITPPQPNVPSRSQYVRLPHSADIPESSHFSDDDLEDLPPSYSSLEPSSSSVPPSYSTLEVMQGGADFFKT